MSIVKQTWKLFESDGPVFGTAVHCGHDIREDLHLKLNLSERERRFEEDPLTQIFLSSCDHILINHTSRFEVDLNRERSKAVYQRPEDAWGLKVWSEDLTQSEIDRSLEIHDYFYASMKNKIEQMINKYGKILVLDFHSFNQRDSKVCPDIDLGYTTLDQNLFGDLADVFQHELASKKYNVRINERYPDGGEWPEWIYRNYAKEVCTITLEYKKIFMDETTGVVDLKKLNDLHVATTSAINVARKYL